VNYLRIDSADGDTSSSPPEFVSQVFRGPFEEENCMTKSKRSDFRPNEFVVYPAHGVGKIVNIEEQEIAGISLELFVISFEKDKMTLRVPTHKATEVGMRSLSSPDVVSAAMKTLKGKAKVKRAMWSRRAQEYEQKINSGDLIAIAEVVRDLHRTDDQREQSYSERQLYEAALERLTREVAAVGGSDEMSAQKSIDDVLTARIAA
jgi:CarD family transcriptional regulator